MDISCVCGRVLEDSIDKYMGRVEVETCPDCMEKAKDEGRKEGYDDGYAEGLAEGESEAQ